MTEILFHKLTIVATNFGILSFLVVLMMDHYRANYNMQSWSTLFHILCVVWLSIRGLFWLCTLVSDIEWTTWAFHTLYWMPDAFEFGAFSLLPMFFAQIIYANEWKSYWSIIKPIYITSMCTICSLQIAWAVMAAFNTECFKGGISGMHPVATNHDVLIDESTNAFAPRPAGAAANSYSYQAYLLQKPQHLHLYVSDLTPDPPLPGGLLISGREHQESEAEGESTLHKVWMAAVDSLTIEHKQRAVALSGAKTATEEKKHADISSSSLSLRRREEGRLDVKEPQTTREQDTDVDRRRKQKNNVQRQNRPSVYYQDCYGTEVSSAASRLLAFALFVGLSAIQAIYGYKISILPPQQYSQYFTAPVLVTNGVNAALTLCFFTRGLYILGTLLGLALLPAIPLQRDDDVALSVLICFEVWDYIPTLLLLLSVTSRPLGASRTSRSFGFFGGATSAYHSLDDENTDMDGGYFSSRNNSGRSRGSDGGSYGESSGRGGGTGNEQHSIKGGGGWLSGWFKYGSFSRSGSYDAEAAEEYEDTRAFRSRSGSRGNTRSSYDRPVRGLGGSSIAPAPDQLEIEIESEMHTQPVQPLAPWGDEGGDYRRSRVPSLGSLERFAAPSSLEPPRSWLSADRMGMSQTSFGSSPTAYGSALSSNNSSRDVSAGTSPNVGPSAPLSSSLRGTRTALEYIQVTQNRASKHGHRPRNFSYGHSPPKLNVGGPGSTSTALVGGTSSSAFGGAVAGSASGSASGTVGHTVASQPHNTMLKRTRSREELASIVSAGAYGAGGNASASAGAAYADSGSTGITDGGGSVANGGISEDGHVSMEDAINIAQSDRAILLSARQQQRQRGNSDLGLEHLLPPLQDASSSMTSIPPRKSKGAKLTGLAGSTKNDDSEGNTD